MLCPWRLLSLSTLALALLGCGGGGGDDDEDEIGGVEDESAVGIWQGTYRLAGMPMRTFNLLAAPNGQFAGLVFRTNQTTTTDTRIMVGTGDTSGANLLATGTLFAPELGATLPNGQASAPISAFSGSVNEGVSLSGSLSAGGETGTFSLSFSPKTNRGSSLAVVQGVYSNSGSTATVTITSGGQLTFNTTSGCVGNGTIASTDPTVNIYSWSMTISNCAAAGTPSGLATLDDFNGAQNNLLVLIGAQTGQTFFYSGSK